jgi:SAM-dependent methyltransferase
MLAEPTPLPDLADRLDRSADRVGAVLRVLASHEIVTCAADGWVLAAGWPDLVTGSTPMSLEGSLGAARVSVAQLEAALDAPADYWALSPADRALVARGMSFDPSAPGTAEMVRRDVALLPGVAEALADGGRVLELGCGLASRLCATLLALPEARGVGVELDESLAGLARERAEALGIADRLTIRTGDAGAFEPDGPFDLVSWSQFFFPARYRAAALATARRALRPGGWITCPVIWDGQEPTPGTPYAQELASMAVLLDIWDVPLRSVDDVRREYADAGFVDLRVDPGPGVHLVRGRQPS